MLICNFLQYTFVIGQL